MTELPLTSDRLPCPAKDKMPVLNYWQSHNDAEKRIKAGQQQSWCSRCQLWQWSDHAALCPVAQMIGKKEFDRLMRESLEKEKSGS